MTSPQLVWATCGYALASVAVLYFTRASARRAIGALAGAAVAGVFCVGMLALGATLRWWSVPIPSSPGIRALFLAGTVVSLVPVFPVTWRLARRFGWRGLLACVAAAAAIGPPRDYLIAAVFPEWIVFAPGAAPVLGVSATYAGFVFLGHLAMRLVAGSARADRLARAPKEAAR